MTVTDFVRGTSWSDKYNQIWTVTPDGATPNEYNFDGVEDYDADKDPLYVNCGDPSTCVQALAYCVFCQVLFRIY